MKKKTLLHKIKRYFYIWDGFWSIPFAALIFIFSGKFMQHYFSGADGQGAPGFYDPSFIQAALYAGFICTVVNAVVFSGFFFNFKGIFRYFIGRENEENQLIVPFRQDLNDLTSWQRIKISFAYYFSLAALYLVVFKILV